MPVCCSCESPLLPPAIIERCDKNRRSFLPRLFLMCARASDTSFEQCAKPGAAARPADVYCLMAPYSHLFRKCNRVLYALIAHSWNDFSFAKKTAKCSILHVARTLLAWVSKVRFKRFMKPTSTNIWKPDLDLLGDKKTIVRTHNSHLHISCLRGGYIPGPRTRQATPRNRHARGDS